MTTPIVSSTEKTISPRRDGESESYQLPGSGPFASAAMETLDRLEDLPPVEPVSPVAAYSRPVRAASNALANASIESNRSCGSFASPRASTPRTVSGTSRRLGDSDRCFSRISPVLSPSNGTRPVSSSYATTASEYWSTSGPYFPFATSGAM